MKKMYLFFLNNHVLLSVIGDCGWNPL